MSQNAKMLNLDPQAVRKSEAIPFLYNEAARPHPLIDVPNKYQISLVINVHSKHVTQNKC